MNKSEPMLRVLIRQHRIRNRVEELARMITNRFADVEELTVVSVLTGSFMFCADLIRLLPMKIKFATLTVTSYPGTATKSQGSQVGEHKLGDLRGKHVLVVEDILDTGGTLKLIVPMLKEQGAASVTVCVLLHKNLCNDGLSPEDYVGFNIPDEFVVGYGLDHDGYYRNLPEVCVLQSDASPIDNIYQSFAESASSLLQVDAVTKEHDESCAWLKSQRDPNQTWLQPCDCSVSRAKQKE